MVLQLTTSCGKDEKGLSSEALFHCHETSHAWHFLDLSPDANKTTKNALADTTEPAIEKQLLCAHCNHIITSGRHVMYLNGQHIHCFRNPVGMEFVIGCFDSADGCSVHGAAEPRWSWFPPYAWSVALCGQCGVHLGWHYNMNNSDSFYGLILRQLLEQ